MAVTEQRVLPPEFIEAAGKTYLDDLSKATGQFKTADLSKVFGDQFVAGPGALQTQAQNLASGLGSFQPFLQTAAASAGPSAYEAFMSPYQRDVISTTLEGFDRQAQKGLGSISDAAVRSGFAEYMKDKPIGFGGQAISYVGLPDGNRVMFGDTGSAGTFRDYLSSIGFNPPSPLGQPLQSSLTATGGAMGSPLQQAMGFADGGRIGYARGDTAEQNAMQASGIMGLPLNENPAGVTELDLRESGGFIPPVGVKEKADDIPAMLSNNEFVFTADAVRGMGDGNVNLGAQRMYDMMKKLENGGRV